jgi:TonB family protein
VILQNSQSLRVCGWAELADSSAGGTVTIGLRIDPNGAVTEARIVDSSLNDACTEECLLRAVVRLRFDPSDAPTVVKLPLRFREP